MDDVKTLTPLRRVVLATDLGTDSIDLFAHGLSIALRSGAELFLVHILDEDHPEATWRRLPTVRGLLERWGALPPSATPAQFEGLGIRVHPLEYHPVDGDLPTALARRITELSPDLLLLGTHVRGWFDETARPSVAKPVAREVHCPTLFVSDRAQGLVDPETGLVRLRRVVLPIIPDTPPQPLVDALVHLLEGLQAGPVQLILVHAGALASLPTLSMPRHLDWTWTTEQRQGSVTEQILEAVAEHEADLIAIATQGHETWLDDLRGSTTERVMQRAPCPVFAIHARD